MFEELLEMFDTEVKRAEDAQRELKMSEDRTRAQAYINGLLVGKGAIESYRREHPETANLNSADLKLAAALLKQFKGDREFENA